MIENQNVYEYMLKERVQMKALMKKRLISVVRRSKLNATCRSQKKPPLNKQKETFQKKIYVREKIKV